jgi:CheY-like chemotaxis protein
MAAQRPILLVEDSEEDTYTIQRLLRRFTDAPVTRFARSTQALEWLENSQDSPKPRMILLDLNLPGRDGRWLLSLLKSNLRFKAIPIVILTTSSSPRDIDSCYRSGANGYLIKPVDLALYTQAIGNLVHYWFQTMALPGVPSDEGTPR